MKATFITSETEAIAKSAADSKPLAVFIVGGEWCPWCVKLKEALKDDSSLEQLFAESGYVVAWLTVQPKNEDTSGLRAKYGVTGVPFLTLIYDGSPIGSTEYPGTLTGAPLILAYADWFERTNPNY